MSKLCWYLKQLVPLTYWTRYKDSEGNHIVIWKMWLGNSYRVMDAVVKETTYEI